MEVILLENLTNIGRKGDLKNVRPGFFRNYLLPYGKAVLATESVKKLWEKRREKLVLEKEGLKTKAKEFLERIAGKTFAVKKKTTKKGTLYSAVTAEKISEILRDEAKVEIPAEMILLPEPLKKIGPCEITVKVDEEHQATFNLDLQAA